MKKGIKGLQNGEVGRTTPEGGEPTFESQGEAGLFGLEGETGEKGVIDVKETGSPWV